MRARISRGIVAAGLALGIGLVSFAGVSLALSDDGTNTSRTAQTPLGAQSAPRTDNEAGTVLDKVESDQNTPGGSGSAPESVSSANPSGPSGGGNSSLPFTGLLAIPVLLAGTALLAGGFVLRRRDTADAQTSS